MGAGLLLHFSSLVVSPVLISKLKIGSCWGLWVLFVIWGLLRKLRIVVEREGDLEKKYIYIYLLLFDVLDFFSLGAFYLVPAPSEI